MLKTACYENKVKIFTSSDVPIFQVFSDEHGGAASEHAHVKSGKLYGIL